MAQVIWKATDCGNSDGSYKSYSLASESGSGVPSGYSINSIKYQVSCNVLVNERYFLYNNYTWYLCGIAIENGPYSYYPYNGQQPSEWNYIAGMSSSISEISGDFADGQYKTYASSGSVKKSFLQIYECSFRNTSTNNAFYQGNINLKLLINTDIFSSANPVLEISQIKVIVEYGSGGSGSGSGGTDSGGTGGGSTGGTDSGGTGEGSQTPSSDLNFTFDPQCSSNQSFNGISLFFGKVSDGGYTSDTNGFVYTVTCSPSSNVSEVSVSVDGSSTMRATCYVYISSDTAITFTITASKTVDGKYWEKSVQYTTVAYAPSFDWLNTQPTIDQGQGTDEGYLFLWWDTPSLKSDNKYRIYGQVIHFYLQTSKQNTSGPIPVDWEDDTQHSDNIRPSLKLLKPEKTTYYRIIAKYGSTIGDNFYGKTMYSNYVKYTVTGGIAGGSIQYYDGSSNTWKNCVVHYYTNGEWKPCTLHYRKSDGWT